MMVLLQATIVYAGVVFAGGTLIKLDRPFAIRTGLALHSVAMIDELIRWSDSHDHDGLTRCLLVLADGSPLRRAA